MKSGPRRSLYQRVQSSDDSEESPPLQENNPEAQPGDSSSEDDLKELTTSQARRTSKGKKTVLIEIKGKAPPGKDGVFALNRDLIPGHGSSVTGARPRLLIDPRKVMVPRDFQGKSRLQERARMMDMKHRIQEQRDRSNHISRSYDTNVPRFAEKPKLDLDVDSKREGVLKVSDRSFCEHGCEALLRVIKNNDKLVELDLSGCHWNGIAWDLRVQG